MKIWLVETGEPLPSDPGPNRLLRIGILAEMLYQRGHQVTWWASNFEHRNKQPRPRGKAPGPNVPDTVTKTIGTGSAATSSISDDEKGQHWIHPPISGESGPSYEIRLLDGPPYRRNVSLARFYNHWVVGRNFRKEARQSQRPLPEVILCCVPTLDLGLEAANFGRQAEIPVVLDYRDLWPEIFVHLFPKPLQPLAKICLWPLFRQARQAFSRATAITGITDRFVEKACQLAGRAKTVRDRAFPLGYPAATLTEEQRNRATAFWEETGIDFQHTKTLCFFGHISPRYVDELTTMIAGVQQCQERGMAIQLVVCGSGDALDACRRAAASHMDQPVGAEPVPTKSGASPEQRVQGSALVHFPGWVGGPEIAVLMESCIAGILPYPSTPDFAASYPNKVIEYLSGGLPVLSSVRGLIEQLLQENQCGFTYQNCDPQDLCRKLLDFCDNPQQIEVYSRNAKSLFHQRFEGGRVYGEFCDYLESFASSPKPSITTGPKI